MKRQELLVSMIGTALWEGAPTEAKEAFVFYALDTVTGDAQELRRKWHSWYDGWSAHARPTREPEGDRCPGVMHGSTGSVRCTYPRAGHPPNCSFIEPSSAQGENRGD